MFEIPMFPTMFYGMEAPVEITENVLKIISSSEYHQDGDHYTTGHQIHQLPELSFYKDYLDHELDKLRIKNEWTCDKLTIAAMWGTRNTGQVVDRHTHPMFFLSFIHYLTEGSPTHFFDPTKQAPPIWIGGSCLTQAKFVPGDNIPVGSILFFPSWIPHSVEPHEENYNRYTVAGNIFPEGNVTEHLNVAII